MYTVYIVLFRRCRTQTQISYLTVWILNKLGSEEHLQRTYDDFFLSKWRLCCTTNMHKTVVSSNSIYEMSRFALHSEISNQVNFYDNYILLETLQFILNPKLTRNLWISCRWGGKADMYFSISSFRSPNSSMNFSLSGINFKPTCYT